MTADWPAPATPEPPTAAVKGLPVWALSPVAAIVWWVIGFLPWILDGLGSAVNDRADAGPTALPLFAGNVSGLVVGSGVGGLAAGLVVLLGRGRLWSRPAITAGMAVAVAVTLVQSRHALKSTDEGALQGLTSLESTDERVLQGLTVIVIVMSVVALVVGLLSLAGRVGLGIALAGVAGAAPLWISSVLYAGGLDGRGAYDAVDQAGRWVGAAVLVAALVSIGVRPAVRLVWWPIAVILAWVVAPTVTAAGYLEQLLRPGMGFADRVGENVSSSLQVWRMAAQPDARPLAPWIVAVVVAGVLAILLDRRRPTLAD